MPRAIDAGVLVGHGPVRAYVMGERGAANEAATADDIVAMAGVVEEALRAGAFGFSTSRTPLHRSREGELVPGTDAAAGELLGHRRRDPARRTRRVPVRPRSRPSSGRRVAVDATRRRAHRPAGQRQRQPARQRSRGVAGGVDVARSGPRRRLVDRRPGGRSHDRHPLLPAGKCAPAPVPPRLPGGGRAAARGPVAGAGRSGAPTTADPRASRRRRVLRARRRARCREDVAHRRRGDRLRTVTRVVDRRARSGPWRPAHGAHRRSALRPRRQRDDLRPVLQLRVRRPVVQLRGEPARRHPQRV